MQYGYFRTSFEPVLKTGDEYPRINQALYKYVTKQFEERDSEKLSIYEAVMLMFEIMLELWREDHPGSPDPELMTFSGKQTVWEHYQDCLSPA